MFRETQNCPSSPKYPNVKKVTRGLRTRWDQTRKSNRDLRLLCVISTGVCCVQCQLGHKVVVVDTYSSGVGQETVFILSKPGMTTSYSNINPVSYCCTDTRNKLQTLLNGKIYRNFSHDSYSKYKNLL